MFRSSSASTALGKSNEPLMARCIGGRSTFLSLASHTKLAPRNFVAPLYRDQPSETLYHYTSLAAVQSIIAAHGLWATDIHYFDDSAELAYTAGLLADEIQKRSANQVGDRSIQDQLLQWVKQRVAKGRILFVA